MAWIIFEGTGDYSSHGLKLKRGKTQVPDGHPILDELRELNLRHVTILDEEPEDVQSADEGPSVQPLAASGGLSTDDFSDPRGEPADPEQEARNEAKVAEQPTPPADPGLAEGIADSNPA